MRKTKKTAKQIQINRNRKQLKRKAKTLAKAKKGLNSKKELRICKNADEFHLDEMVKQLSDPRLNNEQHQFIKGTFGETLKEYSKIDTTCIFSSLLLTPSYQASQYRLEKAIAISLSFCEGDKKPDINLINFILEKSFELFGYMEDPAEDVFISTVWFENKQYKLSTGLWEGGIYQAQIFLDIIDSAPNNEKPISVKKIIRVLLKASDLIITKNGLNINEIGAENPAKVINFNELTDLDEFIDRVKLHPFNEYESLPCIDISNISELYMQELGASDLEETPFFINGNSCSLLLPSSILICIKRQVVNFVRKVYSPEFLNTLFFNYQAKRLHETSLLKEFKGLPIKLFSAR